MKNYTTHELQAWGERELIELVLQLQTKQRADWLKVANAILEIVDMAEDTPRGDVQGSVEVLAAKIVAGKL